MVADRPLWASSGGWLEMERWRGILCAAVTMAVITEHLNTRPESDPMPYKDMREFLDVLRKDGQLKEIDTPIKAAHGDNELQALMRLLCQTIIHSLV